MRLPTPNRARPAHVLQPYLTPRRPPQQDPVGDRVDEPPGMAMHHAGMPLQCPPDSRRPPATESLILGSLVAVGAANAIELMGSLGLVEENIIYFPHKKTCA